MSNRRMHRKFDRILRSARSPNLLYPWDPPSERIVIFSDHHKGDGSQADDFRANARLYSLALDYYQGQGFKLIALGDSEELWETPFSRILPEYAEILHRELDLGLENPEGRKIRIWGNHDKEVSLKGFRSGLGRSGGNWLNRVEYREGLCLGPDIFLVHGHQGRFFEDKAWKLSRWAVKFIWTTIQRLFHIGINGPAENIRIRTRLELSYYAWAKRNRVLLICGHTHRALFASLTRHDLLGSRIRDLTWSLRERPEDEVSPAKDRISRLEKELAEILAQNQGGWIPSLEADGKLPVPCYFNDGCGVFTNGITCLELDRGSIRLIKWDRRESSRRVLVEGDLELILNRLKAGRRLDSLKDGEIRSPEPDSSKAGSGDEAPPGASRKE